MAATFQNAKDLFERYGWKFEARDDGKTILTGFRTQAENFTLGARLEDDWLTLTVPGYLPPVPPERQAEVYAELLQLNAGMPLVRYALLPGGEVVLTADLPAHKKLDYDLFALTLETLGRYADESYLRLYKLVIGSDPPAQPKASAT